MKYTIVKQYIPGNDQIWVSQLDETDQIHQFDTLQEAIIKLAEIQPLDPEREHKIVEVES